MAAKCSYRVVMRKNNDQVTTVSAFNSNRAMSIIPLSVSIKGIPGTVNEIIGFPGSLHARMPTNESTKTVGNVYQANSFLSGKTSTPVGQKNKGIKSGNQEDIP